MSGTEFNYVVNVDTSRLMSAMSEVRSQMGLALNTPGGAGIDVSGGIGTMFNRMMGGLNSGYMFGGTYTNEAMAYTPHYGMIQAQTSLQQEWLVNRYGTQAAQLMKPPGVGAYEYATAVQGNYIDRRIEAEHAALSGARTAFVGGAAGLGAGELASMAGTWAGAKLGASIGAKFGMGALGGTLGGLAGGWFAFDAASDVVTGAVERHYAEIEKIGGVTRELGEIVGSGQGWGRSQRYEMGKAARLAAKDIGMDVQEMGDIMSGARQMGMMPNGSTPEKLRTQLADFGRAIEEGAQALHTSVGNAMSVIKGMGNLGFGAREGISNLISMSGAAGISPMAMYGVGMAGASTANANLLGGRQGFDLFTGSVVSAAGSGLGREEMGMAGGVVGLGRTIAMTQMGAALGPMGDMQLMASMSGHLPGNIFDMGAAAIGTMSQGDMIGNVVHFQTHHRELLRGQGAAGIRAMAGAQIGGMADLMQDLSPSLGREDAERFVMQNMFGMNEVQAKGMYGSMHHTGGGGGGGGAGAAALEAYQNVSLSRVTGMGTRPNRAMVGAKGAFSFSGLKYGAALGAAAGGGLVGGLIGAGAGLAYDLGTQVDWGMMTDGPGLFAGPEAKADFEYGRMAKRYDAELAEAKGRYGEIAIDPYFASHIGGARLERVQLNADSLGGPASQHLGNLIAMGGIQPSGIGPGSLRIGGQGFNIQEIRKEAAMWDSHAVVNKEVEHAVVNAVNTHYTSGMNMAQKDFRDAYERFAAGPILDKMVTRVGIIGEIYDRTVVDERAGTLSDLKRAADVLIAPSANMVVGRDARGHSITLGQEYAAHGLAGAHVRGFLGRATGGDLPGVNAEARMNLTLQGAAAADETERQARMGTWIYENYGRDALGPGGMSSRARASATRAFASHLATDNNFQAALATGNMGEVERVMLGMAPDYAGAPVEAMVTAMKTKKVNPLGVGLGHSDAVGVGLAATFGMAAAIDAVANTHIRESLASSKTIKDATNPVTFLDEAKTWMKEKLDLNEKPHASRRARPGMMENAVGFGEQESAMSTINKALKESNRQQKQTARLLDTIEKRMPMPKTGSGEQT